MQTPANEGRAPEAARWKLRGWQPFEGLEQAKLADLLKPYEEKIADLSQQIVAQENAAKVTLGQLQMNIRERDSILKKLEADHKTAINDFQTRIDTGAQGYSMSLKRHQSQAIQIKRLSILTFILAIMVVALFFEREDIAIVVAVGSLGAAAAVIWYKYRSK